MRHLRSYGTSSKYHHYIFLRTWITYQNITDMPSHYYVSFQSMLHRSSGFRSRMTSLYNARFIFQCCRLPLRPKKFTQMGFSVTQPETFSIGQTVDGYGLQHTSSSSLLPTWRLFDTFPRVSNPRKANVPSDKAATASVTPAPKNPAPRGLIGDAAE
jgi:hypothetical protein